MYRGAVSAMVMGAFLVAAVLAGCGGSDDSTTTMTKSEFVKQGNAICERAEDRKEAAFRKVEGSLSKVGKAGEEKLIFEAAMPAIKQLTAELRALDPPPGEGTQVDEIVSAFEEAVNGAEESHNLNASQAQFLQASKLAEEYGLTACT